MPSILRVAVELQQAERLPVVPVAVWRGVRYALVAEIVAVLFALLSGRALDREHAHEAKTTAAIVAQIEDRH